MKSRIKPIQSAEYIKGNLYHIISKVKRRTRYHYIGSYLDFSLDVDALSCAWKVNPIYRSGELKKLNYVIFLEKYLLHHSPTLTEAILKVLMNNKIIYISTGLFATESQIRLVPI